MQAKNHLTVALLGNPNSGKSSLFNQLTGLNQKVGNFPGVTVEKKTGNFHLPDGKKVQAVDLPGTYSIYPKSLDERVVLDTLIDQQNPDHPDVAIVIVDANNIKRNLLLFTQVLDLGIPVILALNMLDVANNRGQRVSPTVLARKFEVPVISINARSGEGIHRIKQALVNFESNDRKLIYEPESEEHNLIEEISQFTSEKNQYLNHIALVEPELIPSLGSDQTEKIQSIIKEKKFDPDLSKSREIVQRYELIDRQIEEAVVVDLEKDKNLTHKLDKVLTHKIWGYGIFVIVLFLIFQAIFAWAQAPMDFIDFTFSEIGLWLKSILPSGVLTDLLTEGIIPGIGGVLIFIPQIALLFAFIAILEETGYMSRVVFLMDKIMRKFGLNGKSVVPLISGWACAIPAIMATRTIDDWKERLITIFVTPFMSCSARLPVYTILIALVVPDEYFLGIINLQGLALLFMYFLGFAMSVFAAWFINLIIKIEGKGYLIMELPFYKFPRWKNVLFTIFEKSKTFALEAGKIILTISIILWVAASFGPGDKIDNPIQYLSENENISELSDSELETKVEAFKLENSYAGLFGKAIEPVIKPLGFDWKIGIALITSFAAREVFVGTMATIYSVGSEDETTIKGRMAAERNPETGGPMYTTAVGFSLMVFYAFAMQCMSTLAIVKKETNSWKWPTIQLFVMTAVAYVSSLIVYNLLS